MRRMVGMSVNGRVRRFVCVVSVVVKALRAFARIRCVCVSWGVCVGRRSGDLPADGRVRMAWMVEREKVRWTP